MLFLSALNNAKELLTTIEHWIYLLLDYVVLGVEVIGMFIIVVGVVRSIIDIADGKREEKINLAKTIGFALELIMCGEILKTITAHTWEELIILGLVVLIRGTLAILTHWELQNEIKEEENKLEHAKHEVVVEEEKLQSVKATRKAIKKEIEEETKKQG